MKAKEKIEDLRQRIDNLWETIHNHSGAEAYAYTGLMNWFIDQSRQIRSFYEKGQMDRGDEIYNSTIKLIDEAGAIIRNTIYTMGIIHVSR